MIRFDMHPKGPKVLVLGKKRELFWFSLPKRRGTCN
jgi:hypothetical protein